MSKKIIFTTFIVLVILAVSLFGYYFILNNENPNNGGIVDNIRNFLPFGGDSYTPEIPTENENSNNENQNESNTENQIDFTKKLRKISSEPVSGAGILDTQAGGVVRYIEKATGHVYEVELFSPKASRISNTTIPLSYDAVWGNGNSSFVARYLAEDNNTVETYAMTIKNISTSTTSTLQGIEFPVNIVDISAFGTNFFYLQKTTNGSSGVVSGFDGTKKKEVWSSPMKEFNSQFINNQTVLLNTKPLENVAGYLYSINTSNATVKKVLGPKLGLSSLANSDLSKVIFLTQANQIFLSNLDTKTNTENELFPTTFPEKCVWSTKDKTIVYCAVPKENLNTTSLSAWYKGSVTFSDEIWKYYTTDNTSEMVMELGKEAGENIDVIKPTLSTSEQYLVFTNKKDNSLWSLDLTQ